MVKAGLRQIVRSEDMAVMGITEVIQHLPRISMATQKLERAIRARLCVECLMASQTSTSSWPECVGLGVTVIFFVSYPDLGHRKETYRACAEVRATNKMLVIFPFEQAFYREHGVSAEFVGHPLADLPLPAVTRERFARESGLNASRSWIALLPGSRAGDRRQPAPDALRSAHPHPPRTARHHPRKEFEFIIPLAPTLNQSQRKMLAGLVKHHGEGLPVQLVDDARAALMHSRSRRCQRHRHRRGCAHREPFCRRLPGFAANL